MDVVRGEGALQGAGLLGVHLLWGGAGVTAGAGAATGVGRAVRQDGALRRGTGRAGSALTLVHKNKQ